MAAAWRYALTGVGAAIAPGSQKWKGMSADFEIAPTGMRMVEERMTGPGSRASWGGRGRTGRGGGGHRAGQPEVEGHERGLRDRADEDEDDRGDDDRTGVHAQLGAVDQRQMRPVPVAVMSRTMPTSMARPPAVVTISACRAAWRERRRDWLWPMSR